MQLTISDIAKLANVSKSAVSIVLNNKAGVSEKTRLKVLDTIKKYKYNPSHVAQSLAAKETKSIGLIIREIDNPYFTKIMKGVYDTCSQLGYSVLLGSSESSPVRESELISTLLSKRVDGLLISPMHGEEVNYSYLVDLLNKKYPLVLIGGVKNYFTNVVNIDNFNAAYDAVSYLIKLGHTRIAYFAGPVHSAHSQMRLEGYKQALIDNNISINSNFIQSVKPFILDGFEAGMNVFSRKGVSPSAVFCFNDQIAIGLINALLELKIRVPEEVSVIGFDNIDFCEYVKVPLTTIEMPSYEIGKAAANLLIKQIANSLNWAYEKVLIEYKLVERNSCAKFVLNKVG